MANRSAASHFTPISPHLPPTTGRRSPQTSRIESTLLILQHRLKASPEHPTIQVIKNYDQLPMVECYPSQLNQVFMNLFSNAIDALEDGIRKTPEWPHPTIAIHTFTADTNWVTIAISDNGAGICEKVRSQLFELFFTTKPVGKGTDWDCRSAIKSSLKDIAARLIVILCWDKAASLWCRFPCGRESLKLLRQILILIVLKLR